MLIISPILLFFLVLHPFWQNDTFFLAFSIISNSLTFLVNYRFSWLTIFMIPFFSPFHLLYILYVHIGNLWCLFLRLFYHSFSNFSGWSLGKNTFYPTFAEMIPIFSLIMKISGSVYRKSWTCYANVPIYLLNSFLQAFNL